MKALSKAQMTEKADLITRLREKYSKLEEAIGTFNAEMEAHRTEVDEAVAALNEAIGDGSVWLEEITQEQSDYYENKSEKWQEGENGQNYDNWKSAYENVSADEVTVEFPDLIEVPDCDLPGELEELLDEP